MNYQEAINFIDDKNKYGSRLGLDSIKKLLSLLNNPHHNLKYIHVAGTNGKGSTCAYLASCLMETGYKTGLYTSPHLERFTERIQINGKEVTEEEVATLTEKVKTACDEMVRLGFEHPTTFEIITAIGFLYFYEKNVDIVVLEVGLGGKGDATNAIESSLASVITTISYDHMEVLGNTLEEIAIQKAGIIKDNGIVISYPKSKEPQEAIKKIATQKNAVFVEVPIENVNIKYLSDDGSIFDFEYNDHFIENIRTNLIGEHQIYNATTAITTLLTLNDSGLIKISIDDIKNGIEKTEWHGRIELLRHKPKFIIDGAHNLEGVENLVKALGNFKFDRLILGIATLKDKDFDHMLSLLVPMADVIIATEANTDRKLDAERMKEQIEKIWTKEEVIVEKHIQNAVERALIIANENDLILFTGSLYMIGEVRDAAKIK
ncbi:bifunctional folylpolyglutamate synthase/dihydrofolate synthase [Soehngenia saccharolytica]|nr:bifunctional folylpolyglutamate synthase/dihydrofolate synthase [Soehngenia saccharolytica]